MESTPWPPTTITSVMNRHDDNRREGATKGPEGKETGPLAPPRSLDLGPGGRDVTCREFFAIPLRTREDGGLVYDAIELAPVLTIDSDGTCEAHESLEDVPQEDRDRVFWSIYGHIPGEGVECIGDFTTRAAAVEVLRRILGDLRPL